MQDLDKKMQGLEKAGQNDDVTPQEKQPAGPVSDSVAMQQNISREETDNVKMDSNDGEQAIMSHEGEGLHEPQAAVLWDAPAEQKVQRRIQFPHIEQRIGQALRDARLHSGMSMGQLAKAVGTSHQQIYKIEMGVNRLTLSRFHKIVTFLNISPRSFYEKVFQTGWETGRPLCRAECAKILPLFDRLDAKERLRVFELIMEMQP